MELEDTQFLKHLSETDRELLGQITADDEVVENDYSLSETMKMYETRLGRLLVEKYLVDVFADTASRDCDGLPERVEQREMATENLIALRLFLDNVSENAFNEARYYYVFQYPPYESTNL